MSKLKISVASEDPDNIFWTLALQVQYNYHHLLAGPIFLYFVGSYKPCAKNTLSYRTPSSLSYVSTHLLASWRRSENFTRATNPDCPNEPSLLQIIQIDFTNNTVPTKGCYSHFTPFLSNSTLTIATTRRRSSLILDINTIFWVSPPSTSTLRPRTRCYRAPRARGSLTKLASNSMKC